MANSKSGFDMDNWTTQLRKGLLELCVVSLLLEGEMYGYDLVKRLADIRPLVITEGTVYPLLSRLKKAGLVETRLAESSSGPARKYYVLSDEGKPVVRLMQTYWKEISGGIDDIISASQ
jgi:PadR family transcriptional regulator, regulatory protein PadR